MNSEMLNKIDGKLDKLDEKVDNIDITVAKLEVHTEEIKEDVEHHIKRTDLAEDRILRLEKIEQFIRGAAWISVSLLALLVGIIKLK